MASPSNISWDHAGHLDTNALHWEGFPRLLWESLSDEDMTNTHMTKGQAKIEFKAQSTLKSDLFASPVRTAGAGLTKTDAQATYGLRFGRSMYRWKAKEISFPTQLIPYQNTFGVDGNRRNNRTIRICLDAATPVFGPEVLVLPRVARPPPWPPRLASLFYIHSSCH
jgi:hypothetical protein